MSVTSPVPPPTPPFRKGSKPPKWVSMATTFGVYGASGLQLIAASIGGFILGEWCDRRLATAPWLQLLGLFLGLAVGFYQLVRLLTRFR